MPRPPRRYKNYASAKDVADAYWQNLVDSHRPQRPVNAASLDGLAQLYERLTGRDIKYGESVGKTLKNLGEKSFDIIGIELSYGSYLASYLADMYTWAKSPEALCCLIKILLGNVENARKYTTHNNTEDIKDIRMVATILRMVAEILEGKKFIFSLIADLLSALNQMCMNAIGVTIGLAFTWLNGKLKEGTKELVEELGKDAECLPANKLADLIMLMLYDTSGKVQAYITQKIGDLWTYLTGGMRQLEDKQKENRVSKGMRIVADILDAICDLLMMGIICQPEAEELTTGFIPPEKQVGVVGDVAEVADAPSVGAWISAGLNDMVSVVATETTDIDMDPFYAIAGVNQGSRKPVIPSSIGRQVVRSSDVAAVMQKAFGYTAESAKAAAAASATGGCTSTALDSETIKTLQVLKSKWGI